MMGMYAGVRGAILCTVEAGERRGERRWVRSCCCRERVAPWAGAARARHECEPSASESEGSCALCVAVTWMSVCETVASPKSGPLQAFMIIQGGGTARPRARRARCGDSG
eukprot:2620406-Prymnesium_polylepis.1